MTDEDREALAEALASHRFRSKSTGDASDEGPRLDLVNWATCSCGWAEAVPTGSDAPAYAAHLLWQAHRPDALLPVVEAIAKRRAAEELREVADEWKRRDWGVVTVEAVRARADVLTEEAL